MLFLKNFDDDYSLLDSFGRAYAKGSFMATDLEEKDNEYELSVNLPGVNKNDVSISMNNGYLTISVSSKSEKKEDKKSHYIVHERIERNASRSFYVGEVDESQIKAKLNDGILKVNVPKQNTVKEQKYISIE